MDDDRTTWTPGELPQVPESTPPAPSTYPAPVGSPPSGQPPYGAAPAGYPPPQFATFGYAAPGQQFGAPAAPFGAPPSAAYPPPVRLTDGFAITALVFGILGGWLAFVFGPIALSRIKKSGAKGRGMAITGMCLAGALIVLQIGAAVAIPLFVDQRHDNLHDQCAAGDMTACDQLYESSAAGSADQEFGNTCGGRTDGGYLCAAIGARTYGDDAHLDALWDACAGGDGASCTELSWSAEPGSDYAAFGSTCGGRTDGSVDCLAELGQPASTT